MIGGRWVSGGPIGGLGVGDWWVGERPDIEEPLILENMLRSIFLLLL